MSNIIKDYIKESIKEYIDEAVNKAINEIIDENNLKSPEQQPPWEIIDNIKQDCLNPLDAPAKFHGWNVVKNKQGYYKIFKSVGGKVRGIHIGKDWNADKALDKLKAKGYL